MTAAFNNLVDWQISSFINEEYAAYLWDRFGTFYFFNRTGVKIRPAVEEYRNRKKLKDHRRVFVDDVVVDEDKLNLIEEIIAYCPSCLSKKYSTFGWYIRGEVNEGGWNVDTMKRASLEKLDACLKNLKNGCSKTNQNENQKTK